MPRFRKKNIENNEISSVEDYNVLELINKSRVSMSRAGRVNTFVH